jgi:hypothetical protein
MGAWRHRLSCLGLTVLLSPALALTPGAVGAQTDATTAQPGQSQPSAGPGWPGRAGGAAPGADSGTPAKAGANSPGANSPGASDTGASGTGISGKEQQLLDRIRQLKVPRWRSYGLCRYDWSSWRLMDGAVRTTDVECGQDNVKAKVAVHCETLQVSRQEGEASWSAWRLPYGTSESKSSGGEDRMVASLCANIQPALPASTVQPSQSKPTPTPQGKQEKSASPTNKSAVPASKSATPANSKTPAPNKSKAKPGASTGN